MPGFGNESFIAFAPESSFGAGATPTQKLEVISFDVPPKIGVIPDPSLYGARSRRDLYQGSLYYRGQFTVRLNYEGCIELFRGVLWGYSNTLVETGVRDHTVKEGLTERSYEFQVSVGNLPAGLVMRYIGCRLLNFSVKWTAGDGADGMGQATFDLWSKDMTNSFTPTGTPAYPAILPVLHHQAITVDDGTADSGVNMRVRSLEFSLQAPNDETNYFIGSLNPDDPLPSDFLVPTWKLTKLYKTITEYNAAKAFTTGSPNFVFQHPTTIGTTSKREFQLRSEQCKLTDYGTPVAGYGAIIATSTWQARQDPTDVSSVVLRIRNTEAALP